MIQTYGCSVLVVYFRSIARIESSSDSLSGNTRRGQLVGSGSVGGCLGSTVLFFGLSEAAAAASVVVPAGSEAESKLALISIAEANSGRTKKIWQSY
jgi:hypothetical protein